MEYGGRDSETKQEIKWQRVGERKRRRNRDKRKMQ